jgi:hypothetical protein
MRDLSPKPPKPLPSLTGERWVLAPTAEFSTENGEQRAKHVEKPVSLSSILFLMIASTCESEVGGVQSQMWFFPRTTQLSGR